MHIVNENFGGIGKPMNLVPGTKNNNYTHLKLFEEKIKDFIKEKDGKYGVAGMEGKISYFGSNKFKNDPDTYNVPSAYFPGINSDMYAEFMDFTSWSYTHEGDGKWKRSNTKPAPDLRIENELPNWEAPITPTTGTVTQGLLLGMVNDVPASAKPLFQKGKVEIIHPILTRHNYNNAAHFATRMEEFSRLAHDPTPEERDNKSLPKYQLSEDEFDALTVAMAKLDKDNKLTFK